MRIAKTFAVVGVFLLGSVAVVACSEDDVSIGRSESAVVGGVCVKGDNAAPICVKAAVEASCPTDCYFLDKSAEKDAGDLACPAPNVYCEEAPPDSCYDAIKSCSQ